MHVLGIIPARGGSKGVKDKNILNMMDKPLIGYTIEAAQESKLLTKTIVSTDSEKITGVVKSLYDVEVIKRPSELALDDSPIEEALLHAVEYLEKEDQFKTDIVVMLEPNVPIRKKGQIDEVVENLINSEADSCVTCYEVNQIPEGMKIINDKGMLEPIFKDADGIRRQEYSKKYLLDGAVIAIRAENLFKTRGIRKPHIYLGKEIIPVIQKEVMYTIEIDEPEDVDLVRYYMDIFNKSKK